RPDKVAVIEYMTSWLNHSRRTKRSPNIRSKWGASDSMSIKVSLTSKTSTAGRSFIAITAFLENPCVAVGVAEVCEAGVVRAMRIHTEAEPSAPLAGFDFLVPDGRHTDTVVDQLVAHRDDVVDDEVQTLHRTGWRVGQPGAELYRGIRPGWGELQDPEIGCGGVVDVEREAQLVA